jgi:hypothetical protein
MLRGDWVRGAFEDVAIDICQALDDVQRWARTVRSRARGGWEARDEPGGRGLHSSTFQLNLSALYGIGDARRGCVAHVKGVLRGV